MVFVEQIAILCSKKISKGAYSSFARIHCWMSVFRSRYCRRLLKKPGPKSLVGSLSHCWKVSSDVRTRSCSEGLVEKLPEVRLRICGVVCFSSVVCGN